MGRNKYTAPSREETTLEELSKGWPKRISHPLHRQHELAKCIRPQYTCDSCRTAGKDWSFYCILCDFDLHPDCTLESQLVEMVKPWPRTLEHRFHTGHQLVKTRLDSFWCDACGEGGNWWCFYCERCDFSIHLQCGLGPRSAQTETEQKPERQETIFARSVSESYWCNKCAQEGKGACFASEDYSGVNLHLKCLGKGRWPSSTTLHELHKEHELKKSQKIEYLCNKCWTEGRGWSFSCDECDFALHPRCAVELPQTKMEPDWVERLMHEQRRQQLMQRIQQEQQSAKQEEENGGASNETESDEETTFERQQAESTTLEEAAALLQQLGLLEQAESSELEEAALLQQLGLLEQAESSELEEATLLQQLQLQSHMSMMEQQKLWSTVSAQSSLDTMEALADIAAGRTPRRQNRLQFGGMGWNNPYGYP